MGERKKSFCESVYCGYNLGIRQYNYTFWLYRDNDHLAKERCDTIVGFDLELSYG